MNDDLNGIVSQSKIKLSDVKFSINSCIIHRTDIDHLFCTECQQPICFICKSTLFVNILKSKYEIQFLSLKTISTVDTQISLSITSPVGLFSCIAALDSNHAWIGLRSIGRDIAIISRGGEIRQRVSIDFSLGKITVSILGELMVSVYYGNQIMKLTSNGHFECVESIYCEKDTRDRRR